MDIQEGLPKEDGEITMFDLNATYTQNGDQNHNEDMQQLRVSSEYCGEGQYYYVLSTDRWAFDDVDEIITILEDFKKRHGRS